MIEMPEGYYITVRDSESVPDSVCIILAHTINQTLWKIDKTFINEYKIHQVLKWLMTHVSVSEDNVFVFAKLENKMVKNISTFSTN